MTSRRLVYSGTIEGVSELAYGPFDAAAGRAELLYGGQTAFAISAFQATIYGCPTVFGLSPRDDLPRRGDVPRGTGVRRDLHIATHVDSAPDDPANADCTVEEPVDYAVTRNPRVSLDGVWRISLDVESAAQDDAPSDESEGGGAGARDRALVGGKLSATVTAQGRTLSASVAITERNQFAVDYGCQISGLVYSFRMPYSFRIGGTQELHLGAGADVKGSTEAIGRFEAAVEAGRSWLGDDGSRSRPFQAERDGLAYFVSRVDWEQPGRL